MTPERSMLLVILSSIVAQCQVEATRSSCAPDYYSDVDPDQYVCVCTDNETPSAECVARDLDTIPVDLNPSLQRLDVSHNRIWVLNHLGYYELLHNLKITHNNLTAIADHCFSDNTELQILDLSHNLITSIRMYSFAGLSKLVSLDLSNNKIASIQSNSFMYLADIFNIDLSYNALHQLGEQVFSGSMASSLKMLNLAHNHFEYFPRQAISNLTYLSDLDMEQNHLLPLEDYTFTNMEYLTRLSLRECGLQTLENEVFSGLRHLEVLDISHNMFQRFPDKAFYHLTALEKLYIGGNSIRSLGRGNLCQLRALKHFSMRDCKEDSLELNSGAFEENLELVSIDLSKCNIYQIDTGLSLDYLSMLKEVRLHGNYMTSLHESLLRFSDLDILDVSDCPLECDCSILWLRDLLESNQNLSDSARCKSDGQFKKILETDEEEFSCTKSEALNTGAIIGIVIGVLLTLAILGALVFLMWRKKMIPCTDSKPTKESYIFKHRNGKAHYSSSRREIKVLQHNIEDKNGKFIDLPGLENQEDAQDGENEPMYHEVADPFTGPDVKLTAL